MVKMLVVTGILEINRSQIQDYIEEERKGEKYERNIGIFKEGSES